MNSINPNHYYWRVLFVIAYYRGYSMGRIATETNFKHRTIQPYQKERGRIKPNPYIGFELIQYFQQILPPHLFRLGVKPEFEV